MAGGGTDVMRTLPRRADLVSGTTLATDEGFHYMHSLDGSERGEQSESLTVCHTRHRAWELTHGKAGHEAALRSADWERLERALSEMG